MALSENGAIVENFEDLGLSPNEAKVYLALLENHPITGYQLSKISGILRPVVYEMLGRLVEKGGARIEKSNPDTYIPVEIDEFLRNLENDFNEAKKSIATILKNHLVNDTSDYFWNITGEKSILNSLTTIFSEAEEEIYISVNLQRFLDPFRDILVEKLKSGVEIECFSYYSIDTYGLTCYSYNLEEMFQSDLIVPESITVIVDRRVAILANISDKKTGKAVFSKNLAFIHSLRRRLLQDIYMIRIWKLFGTDKLKVLMNNEDRKFLEEIDTHLSSMR